MEMDVYEFPGLDEPDIATDEERARFEVVNDDQATWAMRKLMAIELEVAKARRVADAERERINAWEARQVGRHAGDGEYFRGLLLRYAASERAAHDRKTIDTPYGVVKSRMGQPRWEVNVDEFMEWARANAPDLINVKETPALAAMKKMLEVEQTEALGMVAITPLGEVVPGVSVEPAGVSFEVEVAR